MLIFDGLVPVFSTCRRCGGRLQVLDKDATVHPGCEPAPTEVESLARGWLSTVVHEDTEAELLTGQDLREALRREAVALSVAAVQFAQWGWPVFPLATGSKQPAISKRQGGKGFKDATADVERITRWWSRHPDHNIGLATGFRFDVIDVDTHDEDGNPSSDGVMSFSELLQTKRLRKPVHALVATASGGMHLYIEATGRGNTRGTQPKPGIDYRGLGGYVVAPPSTLGSRVSTYSWITMPSPVIKVDKELRQ